MSVINPSITITLNGHKLPIYSLGDRKCIKLKDLSFYLEYEYNESKRAHQSYRIYYNSVGKENIVSITTDTQKGPRSANCIYIDKVNMLADRLRGDRKDLVNKLIKELSTCNFDNSTPTFRKSKSINKESIKSNQKVIKKVTNYINVSLRDFLKSFNK